MPTSTRPHARSLPSRPCLAVLLLGALLAASPARAAATISVSEAQALPDAPATVSQRQVLRQSIHSNDDSRIAAALQALAADDQAASEAALHASLIALADSVPGPRVEAAVAQIASREPRVFVRHDESESQRLIPVYDAGAAARYTLRRWRVTLGAATASASLRRYSTLPEQRKGQATDAAAVAAAVDRASVDELLRWRDTLAAALTGDATLAPAVLKAATALHDADLLVAIIRYGDDRDALDALRASAELPDATTAARVIDAGMSRDATASHAVFLLAEHARADAGARARLLTLPGSERLGESAAAALARLDDPGVTRLLSELLFATSDERRAAHLALALRLSDRPEAHAAVARYAATPGLHPQLKARLRGTSL